MDTDTPEATVYQEQAREFQRADVVRDVCCWWSVSDASLMIQRGCSHGICKDCNHEHEW